MKGTREKLGRYNEKKKQGRYHTKNIEKENSQVKGVVHPLVKSITFGVNILVGHPGAIGRILTFAIAATQNEK